MGRGLILIVVACLFYSPLFIFPILAQMIIFNFTRSTFISIVIGVLFFSFSYIIAIEIDYMENWLFLPGLVSQITISIILNLVLKK